MTVLGVLRGIVVEDIHHLSSTTSRTRHAPMRSVSHDHGTEAGLAVIRNK